MMKINLALLLLVSAISLQAAPSARGGRDFVLDPNAPKDLVINNRILMKLNGKAISLMDVVKKMDLLFYRQYPQFASSLVARYQFYMSSWQPILLSVIDDHLILADAEEKKVKVTDGDVREEMESLFGPDVVLNIDKIGMTFDEAWELLKQELIVRRMNGMMVRSKALNESQPKEIKKLYEEHLKKNPPQDQWLYRVVSVKSKDENKSSSLAQKIHEVLSSDNTVLESVVTLFEGKEEGVEVAVSEPFERSDKELSLAHKAALQTLSVGNHSLPLQQTLKDGTVVNRIFVLENHKNMNGPSFKEMEDQLQRQVMARSIEKYNQEYIEKLRTFYHITDDYLTKMIPPDFEPFTLR